MSELSKRYAKAFFDYLKESGLISQVFPQMERLSGISGEVFFEFVSSPVISVEEKQKVLEKTIEEVLGDGSTEILNLVRLLVRKKRSEILPEVIRSFLQIVDEDQGVTRGSVVSASALNTDYKKMIEDKVIEMTKRNVVLNYVEDKSLIGGLVAQVGGWTFDDSLSSHLKRLRDQLKRT